MRTAYTISAIGHAAVLLWSVWSLAAKPLPVSSNEGLPVDLVTASDFSNITAGSKTAPKTDTAKPLVEKVAEAKPVEDPTAKVVEKKESQGAGDPPAGRENKPPQNPPQKKKSQKPPLTGPRSLGKGRKQRSGSERGRGQSLRSRRRSPPRRRPNSIPN